MTEETTRHVLPTATGFAARQAVVALRKHNIDVNTLLRRVGLSERDFDNRQGRISANAQSLLLEYAAETLNDTAFGLHLAEQANPREVGLLFYVGSAAKNVSEAVALYARYCRIVNESNQVKVLGAKSGVIVEFTLVGVSRHRVRQNAEFGMAAAIKALREIAGRNIHPTRVFVRPCGQFEQLESCNGSSGARSSLALQSIKWPSRMKHWPSRSLREIGTFWIRFSPFAMMRPKSATRPGGRCGLRLRTRCRGYFTMEMRRKRLSPRS